MDVLLQFVSSSQFNFLLMIADCCKKCGHGEDSRSSHFLAFLPHSLSPTKFLSIKHSLNMEFMRTAVQEGIQGVQCGEGGPFGALVVKNGQIIARGHNMVSNVRHKLQKPSSRSFAGMTQPRMPKLLPSGQPARHLALSNWLAVSFTPAAILVQIQSHFLSIFTRI